MQPARRPSSVVRRLKSGLVQRIWKGLSQERACPKNFEGHFTKAGLSQRACPKSGPVPRILKGMSQERACPKNFKGPPRIERSHRSQSTLSQAGQVFVELRADVGRVIRHCGHPLAEGICELACNLHEVQHHPVGGFFAAIICKVVFFRNLAEHPLL